MIKVKSMMSIHIADDVSRGEIYINAVLERQASRHLLNYQILMPSIWALRRVIVSAGVG